MTGLLLFTGCDQETQKTGGASTTRVHYRPTSQIVATVNDSQIGSAFLIQQQADQETLSTEETLEQLILLEALSEEAAKRGYSKRQEVHHIYQRALVQQFLIQQTEIASGIEVTSKDIKKYYDDHFENYYVPELAKVSHLLCYAKNQPESVLETARKLCAELHKEALDREITTTEALQRLYEDHKDNETIHVMFERDLIFPHHYSGKSRWKGPDSVVAEFADVVFNMAETGQLSAPVETVFGVHIIVTQNRTPKSVISLEEVSERIYWNLIQERRRRFFAPLLKQLEAEAKIDINEEVLGLMKRPMDL